MYNISEPCTICEAYIKGVTCDHDQCPVAKMKERLSELEADREALIAGQETLQKYIAEQREELEQLRTEREQYFQKLWTTIARIQAEAFIEFADKAKVEAIHFAANPQEARDVIDNITKELIKSLGVPGL